MRIVDTSRVRPLLVTLASLPLAASLLGPVGPAQASFDSYLVVGYDTSQKALSVTAGPGLAAMGDNELAISRRDAQIVLTMTEGTRLLVFDSAATASVTCVGANSGPVASLTCAPNVSIRALTKVFVDMSAASVPTITAVDQDATDIWLVYVGGSGPDYVQGGRMADRIEGGQGDDDLFGGRGDDEVFGQEGADQVDGERGSDLVDGGPGNDYVVGDGDVDVDEGQTGQPDWIRGGTGEDTIIAVDGVQDNLVDCENEPGKGEVQIDYVNRIVGPDTYLDVPFNCPLILAATPPLDVEATGDRLNISTTWKRPTFDGNDPNMRYRVMFERLPTRAKSFYDLPNDLDTNLVVGPFIEGVYAVSVIAITSAGPSLVSNSSTVSVGRAAAPPSDVINTYLGRFDGDISWKAAPSPGDPSAVVTYQVALRVKDRKNLRWQKWTALPQTTSQTSVDLSGSLKLFQGRTYQARVRTATVSSLPFSEWVYSKERFAGDLPAPTITTVTAVGGKAPKTSVTFTFEGLSWKLNDFYPLSPSYLKVGGKTVKGTVTYLPNSGSFTTSFPIAGTTRDPNCEFSVEYASANGPYLITPAASVPCRPK